MLNLGQTPSAWSALSTRRKLWVTAYLSNGGDIFAATRTAYPDATEKSSKCMAYELRKNSEVLAAIDFYQGGPSLQEQIASVQETIRQAPAYERANAQRLLAELTGLLAPSKFKTKPVKSPDESPVLDVGTFDDPKTDTSPTKFFVGQLVNQRDTATGILHTGRILAVDDEGQPTQIETVE